MNTGNFLNRFARYIWIMQCLSKQVTSFEKFQEYWENASSDVQGNSDSGNDSKHDYEFDDDGNIKRRGLKRRTLYNLFEQMKLLFGLEIIKQDGVYDYRISDDVQISDTAMEFQKYLISFGSRSLAKKEQVLNEKFLENQNIGKKTDEYLMALDAIYDKKQLEFDYRHRIQNASDAMIHYEVTPLGIKYYNKSWYLYGHVEEPATEKNRPYRFFILNDNRMANCRVSLRDAEIPYDNDISSRFKHYYGVITGSQEGEIEPQSVVLKVYTANDKHKYYNETPIHSTQKGPLIPFPGKNLKDKDNYYLYTYHIAPTYDFIQKLLSDREDVEVIKPDWLRKEIKKTIQAMSDRYKK